MIDSELERRLIALPRNGRKLASLPSARKNQILEEVASALLKAAPDLMAANRDDLARLSADPGSERSKPAFRDRLTLDSKRIEAMAASIRAVAALPDPVGEIAESRKLANGLDIRRVRSPLGTILMIFESRPNVITEVFSLAFKSGNAIALRGGSESRASAAVIYRVIDSVLQESFDSGSVSDSVIGGSPFLGIEDYDRELVGRLLQRRDLFDVCIPRGGDALIARVTNESKIPIIKNDRGVCHLYVHEAADLEMAKAIAINGKTQRPGVCNSLETLLIDRPVATEALKTIVPALFEKGVSFICCQDSLDILRKIARTDGIETKWSAALTLAKDEDYHREYLDLKMNIKIVEGFELATHHIGHYGSNHSESIITRDETAARRFQSEVDSACVYWNASTRFTDGFELGLGGEIGISTQKLHARGPVGLRELTSLRWLIDGTGQVR